MSTRTAFGDLPAGLVHEIEAHDIGVREVYDLVAAALSEDVWTEDVTSVATINPGDRSVAELIARADGVIAGIAIADLVFAYVVPGVRVERHVGDGAEVSRGDIVATIFGPTLDLLTAERTALNFLCHLSGVATVTAQWVAALAGTGASVRDTRKTTPGFRDLEKYAVRCGGGLNHRRGLSDQALIKDNHVLAAGGVVEAYTSVRTKYPEVAVQVEVTTLDQLGAVLDAGADQVMLDNMGLELMAQAVAINAGRATLEASGGLGLDNAREVAETGVDLLAVGALTHSAPVMDIAMDLRSEK